MRTRFFTQTDEPPPWLDCSWATLCMALFFWTNGRIVADKDRLRANSNDHNGGGSNFNNHEYALKQLYGLTMPGFSYWGGHPLTGAQAWELLKQGYGLHINGRMGSLPAYWRRWSPNFYGPHSTWAQDISASGNATWWMDPLGRGTYRGEWMTKSLFIAFVESLRGRGNWIQAVPFKPMAIPKPPPPPTPPARETDMITVQRGTLYPTLAVLRANTRIYDEPTTTSGVVDTATAHETLPYLGYPDDQNTWRIVVRQLPMSNGGPAQKACYVQMNAIEKYTPNPAYADAGAAQRLAAAQAIVDSLVKALNG